MIYVFKTSVKSEQDIHQLRPYLEKSFSPSQWNFDLQDCDHVLRVESEKERKFEIMDMLRRLNFECDELPD